MKTSNILLLSLLAFVLLSMVGANLSLKQQFDSIDWSNPYRGYTRDSLPAFKYLKITGIPSRYVAIESGETFEIWKANKENQQFTLGWELHGDTLVVVQKEEPSDFSYNSESIFEWSPDAYIKVPDIEGIYSSSRLRITGLKGSSLDVFQEGSKMLFNQNALDSLRILGTSNSFLTLDSTNQIGVASIQMRNTSSLIIEKNAVKSLHLQADSITQIRVPGYLLRNKVNL